MTTAKRHFLSHDAFRTLVLFLQVSSTYYVAGTHSVYVPSRGEKYIMSHKPDGTPLVRDWLDDDNRVTTMTPGEAARTELRRAFPGLRRVGWQSDHIRLFDWRWPMLFSGPSIGDGHYIDLKGAYWQIYRRLWLDTPFPGGYGSLSLFNVADALKPWKGARNSLVGICAARSVQGVKGTKTVLLHTKNPYLSPGLWATIQGVLNEIAFQAELMGAIYIATDGYIFPHKSHYAKFEEFLYDNELAFRAVRGKYEIKNWGSYKIERKETGRFGKVQSGTTHKFRSIRLLDTDFPTRLLRYWSRSITNYRNAKYNGGISWEQRMIY